MNKNFPVRYYVEGDDEKKFVNTLKTDLQVIRPGKVDILNVIECEITDARLRTLDFRTVIVLIFDVDTGKRDVLEKNIARLKSASRVSKIITILQVRNLEDELVRSCNIKNIKELLGSKSVKDFKTEFIKTGNLADKLKQHAFQFDKLWVQTPPSTYPGIINGADMVRL